MNKNKILLFFSLTVICYLLLPLCTLSAFAAVNDGSSWTLLPESSDEFDGDELDMSKWNTGLWYDVTSALAFKDSNVSLHDGNLVLTAKKEDFNGKQYTCGAVESKFEVPGTDCYVEVRAKALDKDANVLSAIWMQSSPLLTVMNPNPEIDIMETVNYSQMSSTLHTWEQTKWREIHRQKGTFNYNTGCDDISDDYHIYGLERSNGKLIFYFDGQIAWIKDAPDASFTELSRHMVLSLEGHLGAPVDSKLPSEFLIDYIRTYYRGDLAQGPVSGQVYEIVNRNSGMVLSIPSQSLDNVQLIQSDDTNTDFSKWTVIQNSDSTYILENLASKKVIDLSGETNFTTNASSIIQYPLHGNPNQRWYIVPIESGYFKIISMRSGKALVVLNASTENNTPIIQWTYGDSDTNDEWYFNTVTQ